MVVWFGFGFGFVGGFECQQFVRSIFSFHFVHVFIHFISNPFGNSWYNEFSQQQKKRMKNLKPVSLLNGRLNGRLL